MVEAAFVTRQGHAGAGEGNHEETEGEGQMSIAPPCHTRTKQTTNDWITPRWLIEALGQFDLDPCACIPQPWPCAARQFTIDEIRSGFARAVVLEGG